MALTVPEATEHVPCPLCGLAEGITVGETGRYGMRVRNLCCETCATVYVSPRPSAEAMAEYYRSTYREHYRSVGYPDRNGKSVAPGQPGYEEALERWHRQQAESALALVRLEAGANVLEIGCRHGKTLELMRERTRITPFGIEPGVHEAEQAQQRGIDCFAGSLEEFDPGERRFAHVQWFHVLEHLHDPLGALLKIRGLLAPRGTLLIEVPNVYEPYGLLEENFFQNVHLVSYSSNTLPALLRRAGYHVTRVIEAGALFVLATPAELAKGASLPLPFNRSLLARPEEDADWVAVRLRSYANLEKLKLLLRHRGPSPQLTATLVHALSFPAFTAHMVDTCAGVVEQLAAAGRFDDALVVTLAVAQGPHPLDVRHQFRDFAERLGAPPDAVAAAI